MQLLVLLHRGSRCSGVLHSVRNELVAEKLVHLLKSLALGLREEEPVAGEGDDVEDEEDVEVFELDRAERLRRKLRKYEIDSPVGEGCDGITKGADFDWENLGFCQCLFMSVVLS